MWSQSLFLLFLSWTKPIQSLIDHGFLQYQSQDGNRKASQASSAFILTFQKCAEVSGQTESQIMTVKLMINSSNMQSPFNISKLTIRDAVTGLSILSNMGNETESGFQTYTKEFLQSGEYYTISYTAVLNDQETQDARNISLPAYLIFDDQSQNSLVSLEQALVANFTLTKKTAAQVLPNHTIHFVGFLVAFVTSFILVFLVLLIAFRIRRAAIRNSPFQKARTSQSFSSSALIGESADLLEEKIRLQEKVIDILVFEDPKNMMEAFDDLQVLNMVQVDVDLEQHRKQMSMDATALLLRNFKLDGALSLLSEEQISTAFKEQFQELDSRLQVEHDTKMAMLAAQCNQETRLKMEALYSCEMQQKEEAELITQNLDDEVALQCRKDLDKLHKFEQKQLHRLLLVNHEEASARVQRELVVRLRHELQNVVFDQLKEVTRKEELDKAAVSRHLYQNWCIQFQLEELMDRQLSFQRQILAEDLAHKKYLANRIQRCVNQRSNLVNTTACQISVLINRMKNIDCVSEAQVASLLEMMQQEMLVVKRRLDEVENKEKKLLHRNLISERRKLISEKICEQERQQKEMTSLLNTFEERLLDPQKYLVDWHNLSSNQSAEFQELVEKLDAEAAKQLKAFTLHLSHSAVTKHRQIKALLVQELTNLGVVKSCFQQIGEEQEREINILREKEGKQEEEEERNSRESLEKLRKELLQQLASEAEQQKSMKHQGRLLFETILMSPLTLSEDDTQKLMLEHFAGCSQMDNGLALPRLQERAKLQARLIECRKAKLEQLEQNCKKWHKRKAKRLRSGETAKLRALMEHIKDRVELYKEESEHVTEEVSMICTELVSQKANQMKALEENLGICMSSIQLQKASRHARLLGSHTAILNLQALLLEELSTAGTLSGSECTQIIQAHHHELEQLFSLHSEVLQHKLAVQSQQAGKFSWAVTQSRSLCGGAAAQSSGQISLCLHQAMLKCQEVMEEESQRLREEERNSQLLEDLKEQLAVERLLALQEQEIKLVAYLVQQLKVPVNVMQSLFNLLLPNATENEIAPLISQIYSRDSSRMVDSGLSENIADDSRKRRLQAFKQSLNLKLREQLIAKQLEKTRTLCRKKGSRVLKLKRLQLLKGMSFSHVDTSSEFLPQEAQCHPEPAGETIGQMLNLPDTDEKVFVFRIKAEEPCRTNLRPKKKKRNFLNFKRSTVANLERP
ncbi:limbin [Callorhinchus milii]|uniref:limbin n=1 Tax=Callorhinchus milii TaxID=7868 RepID=UPI001C3F8F88|nr:limbin [Callorhinchus milii]